MNVIQCEFQFAPTAYSIESVSNDYCYNQFVCSFSRCKAWITSLCHGKCSLVVSTVRVISVQQMLLRVVAEGNNWLLWNAFYHSCSSIIRYNILCTMGQSSSYHVEMIAHALVIFGCLNVVSCQFRLFCLTFLPNLINLNVKYVFPVQTYYCNFSTSVPHADGPRCFIDHRRSKFRNFTLW